MIIGADLTYDFEDLPPLISSLRDLASKESIVIIAYGKERAAAPNFLELAAEHFDLTFVEDEKLNTCDIKYPSFSIGIVTLKKKQEK